MEENDKQIEQVYQILVKVNMIEVRDDTVDESERQIRITQDGQIAYEYLQFLMGEEK